MPWYRPGGVAKTSSETKRGRTGLPARVSGRHAVRGTDSPHLSWKCAQVTGKDGQYSGEMGGSSLSPGSPAGRAPLHGDGSMYSQAVIVGTEKVLQEADGPDEGPTKKLDSGGKVIALGASRNRASVPARSPKITSEIPERVCIW